MHFSYQPLGDSAVRIQIADKISSEVSQIIKNYCNLLERQQIKGVVEFIPAYNTITVFYKPEIIQYNELCVKLKQLPVKDSTSTVKTDTIIIPVIYGGDYGPDIEYVAYYNKISIDEVISIHTKPTYLVHAVGFAPGFPFLGGMSKRIATPRLKTPRTAVPEGSVGIAGIQTGIYPIKTPGGWRLIGRTFVRLYNPDKNPPTLLKPGDYVKFQEVKKA
ncbi:5-oxoprolinase subunit PxpB [Peptococcaceae bacterium]|nr:5-oxoprolinase subunit PxpB [Peptococcaceae bacterium]MCL0107614.1 5-oxoprolinase subunit PxpB [Peptococcaceae bacterium]